MSSPDRAERQPAPKQSIHLGLSLPEWHEFQDYVRRHYGSVESFFTEKALELIALGREQTGHLPN